ncbi:hypothetical protein M9H77_30886 [Catharanthus roseus]|uniref:Uncharacterized protein n=1 Tax=Catharanthus roseus TaxID=4058 RepID=A0ACC0A0K2_CATRO|nr:hypothetical protein M9H77_30886 [Catharanthus roseus]
MEPVLRSQTASLQNMENQIELLARMVIEKPPSNASSNTVTLRNIEEQVMTFPMSMDDDDETAQESEEFASQGFQEPLSNTREVEESKKHEYLPENKNESEEGEPEKAKREFNGKSRGSHRRATRNGDRGSMEVNYREFFQVFAFEKVPSGSRNDEQEAKTDKSVAKTSKKEAIGKAAAPTADGKATYHHREKRDFPLKETLIQSYLLLKNRSGKERLANNEFLKCNFIYLEMSKTWIKLLKILPRQMLSYNQFFQDMSHLYRVAHFIKSL